MKRLTVDIYTCDRCGIEQRMDPDYKPRQWQTVTLSGRIDVQKPVPIEKTLCDSCAGDVERFISQRIEPSAAPPSKRTS